MEKNYIEDKIFQNIDFTTTELSDGEYEKCLFVNCNFSNLDLSKLNFSECEFSGCNMSLADLTRTGFQGSKFKDCKLLGLHFDNCNEFRFTVEFDNCVLNLSSFYKRKLKKTSFKNSSLQEVDFTETNLSGSLFANCDLTRAIFENTILEKADLRTAFNYSIDPEKNKIKKAMFSMPAIAGLLDKYDIEIE